MPTKNEKHKIISEKGHLYIVGRCGCYYCVTFLFSRESEKIIRQEQK